MNEKDKQYHREYKKKARKKNPGKFRKWEHNRYDKIRAKIKELKIKLGGKCSECGYNKNFYALEFAHKKGTVKKFAISTALQKYRSVKELENEVKKCRLLCANCHREETHPNGNNWKRKK